MDRRILILPIGIPGSGKSYFSSKIEKEFSIPRVESDYVREQLYGDASIQGDVGEVFDEVYRQIKIKFNISDVCILDATNVTKWARQNAFFRLLPTEVIYIIMDNNYARCSERNAARKRVVPEYVLRNMNKKFKRDFPQKNEVPNLHIFKYDDIKLIEYLKKI